MTKKNTEIAKVEQDPTQTPMALIAMATEKGVDVNTLERLMTLQERWEKNQAKKAFDEAMAKFQGECPIIKKEKKGGQTSSGQVAYYYAPLDSIVSQTKDLIKECGFSYMVKTDTKEAGVSVTCIVKHELGHSEESTVEVPLGTKTNVMSASQVVAAALTFAKRYAFCNAFGILTGDDDNDGAKMGETKTEQKPKSKFDEMMLKLEKVKPEQLYTFLEKIKASPSYTADQKNEFIAKVMEIKNRQ